MSLSLTDDWLTNLRVYSNDVVVDEMGVSDVFEPRVNACTPSKAKAEGVDGVTAPKATRPSTLPSDRSRKRHSHCPPHQRSI